MAIAAAKTVLDLLFPPPCIGCRAATADSGFCAACLAQPPAFDQARAILAYDDNSRGAILALKHADRLELVPGFARWLARTAVEEALQPVGGTGTAWCCPKCERSRTPSRT